MLMAPSASLSAGRTPNLRANSSLLLQNSEMLLIGSVCNFSRGAPEFVNWLGVSQACTQVISLLLLSTESGVPGVTTAHYKKDTHII